MCLLEGECKVDEQVHGEASFTGKINDEWENPLNYQFSRHNRLISMKWSQIKLHCDWKIRWFNFEPSILNWRGSGHVSSLFFWRIPWISHGETPLFPRAGSAISLPLASNMLVQQRRIPKTTEHVQIGLQSQMSVGDQPSALCVWRFLGIFELFRLVQKKKLPQSKASLWLFFLSMRSMNQLSNQCETLFEFDFHLT